YLDEMAAASPVAVRERSAFLRAAHEKNQSDYARTGTENMFAVGSLSGLPEHAKMVAGEMYTPGRLEDGRYTGVISEAFMKLKKATVGETLTFTAVKDRDGKNLQVLITGVFTSSDETDPFWFHNPSYYNEVLLIPEEDFKEFFTDNPSYSKSISADETLLFEYQDIDVAKARVLLQAATNCTAKFTEMKKTVNISPASNFRTMLTDFFKNEVKIRRLYYALQTPIFFLLILFIIMAAGQTAELERAEIAVLRSRGVSAFQVMMIYFFQSLILSAIAFLFALPLSLLIVRVLCSASDFLRFVRGRKYLISLNGKALLYGAGGGLVSIIAMMIPVIPRLKTNVINRHQRVRRRFLKEMPLWQKLCIDIVLIALSVYRLTLFKEHQSDLIMRAIRGETADPRLFIYALMLMLGISMFLLRVVPLIVRGIYLILQKILSPAQYTALLRLIHTKKQQSFITIFLAMTLALGVFSAMTANTINTNREENTVYLTGTDVRILDLWTGEEKEELDANFKHYKPPRYTFQYKEPDFAAYTTKESVESSTRVLLDDRAAVASGGGHDRVTLMGISPKEFGETIRFDSTILNHHINEYLNLLSMDSNGVILSSNFKKKYKLEVGDQITYFPYGDYNYMVNGTVFAFVDYFPGYSKMTYKTNSKGVLESTENYLIIANYSTLRALYGVRPYEVWLKTDDEGQEIKSYIEDNGIITSKIVYLREKLNGKGRDPVMQGTNGILTGNFVTAMVLSFTGFLIYWILSVRERELQFGIFRAMGMSMREVIGMLLTEQLFITGGSVVIGAFSGAAAAYLFLPLLQVAYSSAETAIPLKIIMDPYDVLRMLAVIVVMLILCMIILGIQIRRMKVSQALKLGED
ncbi:MAG: FtsX-like permease family protein, partial [Lachnospiraceae bacterium]|nr:FtsX-like permease family protein [Lachnospiraceae bacterium]